MSHAEVSSLARTFCKVYSELQEVRLAACYSLPSVISAGDPKAPIDLAWWLCSYQNALVQSDASSKPELVHLLRLWSLVVRLVPLIGDGSIQQSKNPAELYLEWVRDVAAVDRLFGDAMQALDDPTILLAQNDVQDILTTILQLVAVHRFGNAVALLNVLLAHIRRDAMIDAGCERSISEIINLLINDFGSPVQYQSWQAKARDYMKDARFQLQDHPQDAATVTALKRDMLKLLLAFSGDAKAAYDLVGHDPLLSAAAVCTFIDPFMTYDDLGKRASTLFNNLKNPAECAIGDLLGCITLSDVVSVMANLSANAEALSEKSTDSSPSSVVLLMTAAHIADAASLPFAASPAAMPMVVAANRVLERYVVNVHRCLREEEENGSDAPFLGLSGSPSSGYRICALYLAWRPFADPSVMKKIIESQFGVIEGILLGGNKGGVETIEVEDDEDNENTAELNKSSAVATAHDGERIDAYVAALDDLAQLMNSLFHMNSLLQMRLRPIVVDLTRQASSTAALYQWWDTYISQVLGQVRDKTFAALINGHQYSELLIRSVAANHYVDLKRALSHAIESSDALTHPAVLQCGECITSGLVDVAVLAQQLQQQQHPQSSGHQPLAILNSSTLMNASTTLGSSLALANTVAGQNNTLTFGTTTSPLSETIALLHITSCIWDMTAGAHQSALLASADEGNQSGSSSVLLSEGDASFITAGALRLADSHGFERLADSVRFSLLQKLTTVFRELRATKSTAAAAFAFGTDGQGVARAKNFQLLLIDLATSIDGNALEWESGNDDLENLMTSLVTMSTCWC